ncbi:Rrf2 family transcriptional regulator [Rhizobium sp. RU36D]|uniref:Rrf2 family transcriptional regulator n=1 Tax=Rhizobium sp. RU36D TaxID=1907415 RepID=UPI0009D852D1|nr:Rrf2 family transcriptional regulator [Rhizobium sp. RU36D]SMD14039.1 transcriptional regulator, BadM/Rrf2 family [Rhizobium sp. RU36D]
MRGDSRLSRMLHVLIHLGRHSPVMTSEAIAAILTTNPVVVRRTMAGLRDRGYVQSEKGHGGGWSLVVPLEQISLLDVYEALDRPPMFCLVPSDDHAECLVEKAVNAALEQTRMEAEALMLQRFGAIRLSDIASDFEQRMSALVHPGH